MTDTDTLRELILLGLHADDAACNHHTGPTPSECQGCQQRADTVMSILRMQHLIPAADAAGEQNPDTPYGWAAWSPDGTLIAHGPAQPGLSGWQSLGIGSPGPDVILDPVPDPQRMAMLETFACFRRPGGRAHFRMRDNEQEAVVQMLLAGLLESRQLDDLCGAPAHEMAQHAITALQERYANFPGQQQADPQTPGVDDQLARTFANAVNLYGLDARYHTADTVLGEHLVRCLHAYGDTHNQAVFGVLTGGPVPTGRIDL